MQTALYNVMQFGLVWPRLAGHIQVSYGPALPGGASADQVCLKPTETSKVNWRVAGGLSWGPLFASGPVLALVPAT